MDNKKRAIFLDRDGVVTQEPPYYAHQIKDLRLINKCGLAIKKLNSIGFKVIIVTNQAGIAKGYYKEDQMHSFNNELISRLKKFGAMIDAIYFCPHHKNAVIKELRIECNCRKPNIGLILKAQKMYNLDLNLSYFIGDKKSDIDAGLNAGCKTILVETGQGKQERFKNKILNHYHAKNLFEAVNLIFKNENLL